MAKSIKLQNEIYLDSTSVVDNKETLSEILSNIKIIEQDLTPESGGIKLANGLIINWGIVNITSTGMGNFNVVTDLKYPINSKKVIYGNASRIGLNAALYQASIGNYNNNEVTINIHCNGNYAATWTCRYLLISL